MKLRMITEEQINIAKPHIARSVSKNGDFDLAYEFISSLEGKLNESQVIDLYEYIRDNSDRLEDEWRDEFLQLFDEYEDLLPEQEF